VPVLVEPGKPYVSRLDRAEARHLHPVTPMRSYASIKGHPLHPALVSYPFAFLTGAFAFGLAARATRRRDLQIVADRLVPAGLVAGVAAASAGLADYINSVPPRSSGKERATKHGLLNSTAMTLFAASWLMRRRRTGRTAALALQGVGTAVMTAAGWMGGTLVYRNQIGVDHRYARAGKWQENAIDHPASLALVAKTSPLKVDQMELVHADDERIVVARTETGVVAFEDRCTHKGGPLSDGVLICGTVQCPWHGSQFDVETGAVKCGPARLKIRTYPIEA
jgi:nitrite reductase/ring-hydroxylating ferredoxin subunit/uncharacterized membrane protein